MTNILVAGGAGYIGSQLIRDIGASPQFEGDCVTVYDNMQLERYQSLMDLPVTGNYDFHAGDVQDVAELTLAARDAEIIIHLAALTNAVLSFDRVAETESINHMGTQNVITAAIRSPRVKRVIYASTCSVYGETHGVVNEESDCRPESPYATYKLAGERGVLELGRQTDGRIRGTALRLATVFGPSPGLRVHTVVNIFALHGALGMPITVYGTGEQKRPFVHVRDASSAFLFALANESTMDQALNVVGENASVKDVLSYVQPRFPKLRVRHEPGRHLNQLSYEVDGARLRNLGWSPRHSVEDGIEEFSRYYAAFSKSSEGALTRG